MKLSISSKKNRFLEKKTLAWVRDWQLYVMIAVPMIYYIIFKYIPIYGVTIAFKNFNIFKGILGSEWIGFETFEHLFVLSDFKIALRNTLMLNLMEVFLSFPVPILLAICVSELTSVTYKKISQTILYLPHFLSWVIVGGIVYQLFATNTGVVNNFIAALGGSRIPFLTNKWYWLVTYLFSGIWQSAGWSTIIYLAAITGIDTNLYEAAEVDGASRLRRIYHITMPCIKGTIVTLLILKIGQIMGISFERPYVMGNTLVREFSEVLSTFSYRIGLQNGDFGLSTAAGFFQSVVGFILIIMANFIAKRAGEQGIW